MPMRQRKEIQAVPRLDNLGSRAATGPSSSDKHSNHGDGTCRSGVPLYSRSQDGTFSLKERKPLDEKIACPNCGLEASLALDPVPGSVVNFSCVGCRREYRAVRRAKDINLKQADKGNAAIRSEEVSEELLIRIRNSMGPQPWPRGRSRVVASQLDISHAILERAIQQLISRGDFRLQLNGKLYEPVPSTPKG